REQFRVLTAGGIAAVAAISRYASALDGLARKLSLDPRFVKIRDRDLADGQHRNDTNELDYFTTAYFHRPDDLCAELEAAGFRDVTVLGVEGADGSCPTSMRGGKIRRSARISSTSLEHWSRKPRSSVSV